MRIRLNGYGREDYNESSEYRKKTHEHMMTFKEERRPKFPIGSIFNIDKKHSHLHDNWELENCKRNTRFKVVGYGMMEDDSTVEGHKWDCEHDVGEDIWWDMSKHVWWCYVVTKVNEQGRELKTKFVISNASLTEKLEHQYVSVISSQLDTEQK